MMRFSKLFTIMSVALMMGLIGCVKEDPDNTGQNKDDGQGKTARISLSLTVPTNPYSRASQDGEDHPAVAGESEITTVDVFIFQSNGTKADEGAHTRLALTDFNGPTGGTYTLKPNKLIQTPSGSNARIYVGANLGDTFNTEFADEATLLTTTADVDNATTPAGEGSMSAPGKFWMFCNEVEITNLKIYQEGNATSISTATVELERVVAKVVVTAVSPNINNPMHEFDVISRGDYTVRWDKPVAGYGATDYEDLEISYMIWGYRPVQNAKQSYVAPNYLNAVEASALPGFPAQNYTGKHKTYTPYNGSLYTFAESIDRYENAMWAWTGNDAPSNSQRFVYTNTTPVSDPNELANYWYYIGENRDYTTPSAYGKSTYMLLTTCVSVNKQAVYDLGDDKDFNSGDNEGIRYIEYHDTDDGLGGAEENIYIIKDMATGKVYITANEDEDGDNITDGEWIAQRIALDAGWDGVTGSVEDYAKTYEYPYGFVHFPIYLDGYAGAHVPNRYGIFRNQFLHVNISGINGGPGLFPGYPGDYDGDPTTDPDDPDDPDNPNPWPRDPDKPIDGATATLEVQFTVAPWYYLEKEDIIVQ